MKLDLPVGVVGAGLSGLVTAYELNDRGIECRVLEASPRAGGRVRTVTFADGVSAEAGMEEFWQGNPAYALLGELELPRLEDVAHSSLVLENTLFAYEGNGDRDEYLSGLFDARERRSFLAWNARVSELLHELSGAAGPERALAVQSGPLSRARFDQFVRSSVDSARVAEWTRIVVESETAIEWNRIGALDGVSELRPFVDTAAGFGELNAHVAGGNGRLVEALINRLPGDAVQTTTTVTRVRDIGSHAEIHSRSADGRSQILRCDQVVLTTPVWATRSIAIEPEPSSAVVSALSTIGAGSYVKVVLRLRRGAEVMWAQHGTSLFTLLTDGPAGCVYLSTPQENRLSAAQPRDHVMTMLIYGGHARSLTGLPDGEIARRAIGHLARLSVRPSRRGRPERLFADVETYVSDAIVFAYPRAVAYWPHRLHRSRFDTFSEALRRPHGRIHFAGDTTECSHSDGAAVSAQRVAAAVVERLVGWSVTSRRQ